MYEVMRYWDEDRSEWDLQEREFAAVWRRQPKWVVSRSLKSVGPNATLVQGDVEGVIRGLKAKLAGDIEVGGPELAQSLGELGLVDEYQILLAPRRAWSWQAILYRPPAASPPCGQRRDRRRRDQIDVRRCLIAQLAPHSAQHIDERDRAAYFPGQTRVTWPILRRGDGLPLP
jgi:hypothetical protein